MHIFYTCDVNSSKANITQSNTILNVPLFRSGTSGSALQTFDGNKTAYRAQLWASGQFGIYKTIDGGISWSATKIITDPIGFSTDVYQTGNLTISTSTAPWSISATKSGYTVLMCSPLIYGYSAEVIMAPEGISFGNGSFSMSGFMRRYSGDPLTINIKVIVLWIKN